MPVELTFDECVRLTGTLQKASETKDVERLKDVLRVLKESNPKGKLRVRSMTPALGPSLVL